VCSARLQAGIRLSGERRGQGERALDFFEMDFTRKAHRLDPQEYLGQKWSFVTMCCENRNPIFLNADRPAWIVEMLRSESILHQFLVDAYCVMPNHMHFLVFGKVPTSNLLVFSKSFKQKTAHLYQRETGVRLWQKNYYDHVLRANEGSNHVAAYIWMNPVRKGLCKNFEEYPFSGSFIRPWKTSTKVADWTPPWKQRQMPA
jgi:putative transposase